MNCDIKSSDGQQCDSTVATPHLHGNLYLHPDGCMTRFEWRDGRERAWPRGDPKVGNVVVMCPHELEAKR